MHTTYILYSGKIDTYYRGIPWKIVYWKEYETKSEAYCTEMYIKSQKSRKHIESLILEQAI